MDSDSDNRFQYMMEVENGWIHGLEYTQDQKEYSPQDLENEPKDAETILRAAENFQYDQTYNNFTNQSLDIDKVEMDTTNGIIDVYKNGNIQERYTLVGILTNEDEEPEIIFGGLNYDNTAVQSQNNNEIDWNMEMAAAYEAVYHLMDLPKDTETETVSLYGDQQETAARDQVSTMNNQDARQLVKAIDDFIASLQNDTASGIKDFEDKGEITIGHYDHYGSARNYDAARQLKTDLNRLKTEGLLDYNTEPLNQNGDVNSVDLKIEKEFLDGKGSLREDVDGLSDFDTKTHEGRTNLTQERMS